MVETGNKGFGKRLVATFVDDTGEMELVWFRGHKWIKDSLKINEPYVVFGRCNWFNGVFSMPHPEMELMREHEQSLRTAMQPVYPSTEKLTNKGITNRVINQLMQELFNESGVRFHESLPKSIIEELHLISKAEALFNIHFPKSQELLAKAQFRLKFEELFFIQLQLVRKNLLHKQRIKGFVFDKVGELFQIFTTITSPLNLPMPKKGL